MSAKQPLQMMAREAQRVHSPRTEVQPQACWSGRRTLTALVQNKEEGGSCYRQAGLVRAGQTGRQWTLIPHRRAAASSLDGPTIPDGSDATQRGRRQPLLTSSSCECRPDKHTVCMRIAPKGSRKLARLVEVSRRLVCKAKRKAAAFVGKAAPASASQTGTQCASTSHG